MTSVIELSTSVGFSSALERTAAATGATLAEIEAKLASSHRARTQHPAADGTTLLSDRSIEDKLRICQEETATARMLQVTLHLQTWQQQHWRWW